VVFCTGFTSLEVTAEETVVVVEVAVEFTETGARSSSINATAASTLS
jgi:hypothetical protein